MAGRLYHRGVRVTVITPSHLPGAFFEGAPGPENAIEITDLRVEFSIEKSVKQQPNSSKITIYNAAERTRTLFKTKPLSIWLDAGYDGELRQLFTGDVRHADNRLEKPEWKSEILLGDGDRAYRLARVNRTYAAGTPLVSVVQDVAKSMGLALPQEQVAKLGGLQTQVLGAQSTQGWSRDELTRLLAPFGVNWSIQNGRLQLLRDTDAIPGTAILISQETGMEGTPDYTTPSRDGHPPCLRVHTRLYPQLTPGALIQVYSRDIKGGYFRIQKVHHRGDTHGKPWTSSVEAIPADPRG